jgi:hypothetical protein
MRSDVTGIGQHTKPSRAVSKDKLHRFARIVRNRERVHPNIADRERFMTVDDRGANVGVISAGRSQSPMRQQYGPTKSPRTGKSSSDVVGVFMRDQHCINVFGRQTQSFKPTRHIARAETGINQQAGTTGFDQQGIAPAATAE